MDFDDMLGLSVALLQSKPDVQEQVSHWRTDSVRWAIMHGALSVSIAVSRWM